VKLNNTYLLFDSEQTANREGWVEAHTAVSSAIRSMRWPDKEGVNTFRIPRIVALKPGSEYVDAKGKTKTVKEKKNQKAKILRNGVGPLRDQFRRWMGKTGWICEESCSLAPFFKKLRESSAAVFTKFPTPAARELEEAKVEALNESVGDFDFWFQTKSNFRTVVEWETGNISSSHRSLNKMCLALMGGIVDAGVLIVPSKFLYLHLTDRIGNIRELQPYFYFWNRVGTLVDRGLLAVVEVEHDELFSSTDLRDFVPIGTDGNSKKAATSIRRRSKSAKKR
jgi:hypothetical protein